MKTDVDKKYPNDFMQSPLIEYQMTEQKNEILRKIKFFQAKKLNLPNFIRVTRE